MLMPGRKYEARSGYRYTMNGQEREKEVNENVTSAEFWMYDSRIARRWNTDPVFKEFESPYLTFSGNPIWMADPNGDSTPVHNRLIDRNGSEITTPTTVWMPKSAWGDTRNAGFKDLGNGKTEITPGTFMVAETPRDGNTNVFKQVEGDKFTWAVNNSGLVPTLAPPPPPPGATPILQFNTQITGVQNVRGPVGNINQTFNIAFNGASGTADAARFTNPAAGVAQINVFANRLRGLGITTGVNITIGTDFVSQTSPSNQYGTSGGLLAARGRYIQSLFGGIRTNLTPPAMNSRPQITVTINQNLIGIIGWNVTTQAMQRQVLRGNVIPGSTQSVPGSAPSTNFQRNNGGRRPRPGSYTGQWQ